MSQYGNPVRKRLQLFADQRGLQLTKSSREDVRT